MAVSNGDVTLKGMIDTRTVKQLAENMAETVSGLKEVHNQLRVVQAQDHSMQQGSQSQPYQRY